MTQESWAFSWGAGNENKSERREQTTHKKRVPQINDVLGNQRTQLKNKHNQPKTLLSLQICSKGSKW